MEIGNELAGQVVFVAVAGSYSMSLAGIAAVDFLWSY